MADNNSYFPNKKANNIRIKLLLFIDNEIQFQIKHGKNIKLANEYLFHIDYKEFYNHKEIENIYFSFSQNPKTIIMNKHLTIIEKPQKLTKFSRDDSVSTNDTILRNNTLKQNYIFRKNKKSITEKNKKSINQKKDIHYLKQLCNNYKKIRKVKKDIFSYKSPFENLPKSIKFDENNDVNIRKSVNKKCINLLRISSRARTCKKANNDIKRDYTNKCIIQVNTTLSLKKDVSTRKKKVVCFKDNNFN